MGRGAPLSCQSCLLTLCRSSPLQSEPAGLSLSPQSCPRSEGRSYQAERGVQQPHSKEDTRENTTLPTPLLLLASCCANLNSAETLQSLFIPCLVT